MNKGYHRSLCPRATLKRLGNKASLAGISRLTRVDGLDIIGIPIVCAVRPNSKSLSTSMGKGVDFLSSYVSAYMESLELYSAEEIKSEPKYIESAASLHSMGKKVQLEGLTCIDADSVDLFNMTLEWIKGEDLIHDETIYVPLESVSVLWLYKKDTKKIFQSSTNGLASGNDTLEATVHAICEAIERDAFTLWNESDINQRVRTRVHADTIDCPTCISLLQKINNAGIFYRIYNLTTDIGIPVFAVLLIDGTLGTAEPVRYVIGAGCHLRKEIALSRAITEAAQERLTVILGTREDIALHFYESPKRHEYIVPYLASGSYEDFKQVPSHFFSSIKQELDFLIEALSDKAQKYNALNRIIRVDITHPNLRVACVKVLIPYLENPSDEEGYKPGVRAKRSLES